MRRIQQRRVRRSAIKPMNRDIFVYDDLAMRSDISAAEKVSPQNMFQAKTAVKKLHQEAKQGWLAILDDKEHLKAVKEAAKRIGKFKNCLVLGIGGSDLGARAILSALGKGNGPCRIWFSGDTTDPDAVSEVLDQVPWDKTCINVISKSGGTLETMSVFFEARQRLEKKVGKVKAAQRIICTTDPESGDLHDYALEQGYAMLPVPKNIGGRFSVLTAVGLFPLLMAGVKIDKILEGAVETRDSWLEHPGTTHGADRFAAWQYAHQTIKKRNMHVLFTYSLRMRPFSMWWKQLWAESLGKKSRRDGKENAYGPTPTVSVGPTDQHSQLQLYQEGPDDKIYTFVTIEEPTSKLKVPKNCAGFHPLAFAAGKSFKELLAAEANGTMEALIQAKRPVGNLHLNKIDEKTIGGLIVFFEIATAMAGELYDINAFDQPGVEAGKKRAKEFLTGKTR